MVRAFKAELILFPKQVKENKFKRFYSMNSTCEL
jgi:hypothetical protein